ncbi:MAG: MBL fold metallo-hydrolase [Myxococcota bacterium]|nr:MBL fold metallo-hydrolase [Myxococcota bacterium]
MVTLNFNKELVFEYGVASQVTSNVRRLVAKNPGPFTLHGTGTYIVGDDEVAIIDPGPKLDSHLVALLEATADSHIRAILVTHSHLDHVSGAVELSQRTGAPIYGSSIRPPADDIGNSVVLEEGFDFDFKPTISLEEGDKITGSGWTLKVLHTPGHTLDHLCFELEEENLLFTGDHVMGWATTVVSPPEGNMGDYMRSLNRLMVCEHELYIPTHGSEIEEPRRHVQGLIEHRLEREQQVLECLGEGICGIQEMVRKMYVDVPEFLHPAAARSVLSHLIYLCEQKKVACSGGKYEGANYHLIG